MFTNQADIISGSKPPQSRTITYLLISVLIVGAIGLVLLLAPIQQDIRYHHFADNRTIAGIPHFWNVLSNLLFFLVGMIGLCKLWLTHRLRIIEQNQIAYGLLFIGVTLVALGSGYYHLQPNNHTLLWDRLPMTIAFMSLMAVVVGEYFSAKAGKILLIPLIVVGVGSVMYWYLGEMAGNGDLRPYILVQFLPIIVLPAILFRCKTVYNTSKGYWLLLVTYFLAKIAEHFDAEIYGFLLMISGHSIKHILAAIGLLLLINYFGTREKSNEY